MTHSLAPQTHLDRAAGAALNSVSRSHVGHVRTFNEDRVLERADRGLFAVADGMGGHRGGDVAAELAVAALSQLADSDAEFGAADIVQALEAANDAIHRYGREHGATIGATIVALLVRDDKVHIVWAGDSRAYRIADGTCRRLTTDHSVVQELVDAGAIDERAAAVHPQAHVITRALGAAPTVQLDHVIAELRSDDIYMLCSDGLSRSLKIDQIIQNLSVDRASADILLTEALRVDGSDNISFILIGTEAGT